MHLIPVELGFMSSQDRQQLVLVQELIGCRLTEEIGASSHIVGYESLWTGSLLVFYWIGPENVTEQTNSGWFLESLQVLQIVNCLKFW